MQESYLSRGFSVRTMVRKRFFLLLLLGLFAYVFVVHLIPEAYADPINSKLLKSEYLNFLKGFGTTIIGRMHDAYQEFADFTDTGSTVYGPIESVTILIKGIASMLVVLFIVMMIVKESERGEVTPEFWFRCAAQIIIALVVIISLDQIMDSIYKLGNLIIQAVYEGVNSRLSTVQDYQTITSGAVKSGTASEKQILAAMKQIPGLENIDTLLKDSSTNATDWYEMNNAGKIMQVLEIVVYAPMLAAMYLIFSAVFEVKIRQIFAPIAVSTISYEGTRSSAVRFLKKYLACFLKIAIYFLIACIGALLTAYFFGQVVKSAKEVDLIMMLLANIIAAMAMMQSGGIADEILGI